MTKYKLLTTMTTDRTLAEETTEQINALGYNSYVFTTKTNAYAVHIMTTKDKDLAYQIRQDIQDKLDIRVAMCMIDTPE